MIHIRVHGLAQLWIDNGNNEKKLRKVYRAQTTNPWIALSSGLMICASEALWRRDLAVPEAPALDPARWVDEHGDALYAYCLLRVRERATAEDLVQETLISALTAADSFKGQSSERTWLIGILKHKILDHLRKSGREQPLDAEAEPAESTESYFDQTEHWKVSVSDWAQPDKALENERFWTTFNNCMEKLPERLRVLYALRELDGLETEELLETLNISTANNLWVMLSRARVHLRQCLENNWFKT